METSLRFKIQIGYLVLLIPLFLSLILSYISLNSLWHKIKNLETIDCFTQNLLDVRRYEKNFFLYNSKEDLQKTKELTNKAIKTLQKHKSLFFQIDDDKAKELIEKLNKYFSYLVNLNTIDANEMRKLGHDLVIISKDLRDKELAIIDGIFEKLIVYLFIFALISIGIISGVGYFMARRVVSPLENLEECMKKILKTQKLSIDCPRTKDKEIRSVIKTLNIILQELEARKSQLVQSEKLASLGTLLFGVAHELNNPLSNASSSCQILLEDIENMDKNTAKAFIEQIDREIWRARDIVLSLLELSRYRNLKLEEINLYQVIQEVLSILKDRIKTNLKIDIDVDKGLNIYVDKKKFQQVLINLLSNAIDALEDDGHILVKAYFDHGREGVVVTVKDNGCGIPTNILNKIFDPFFTTKGVKGSGLGLYLVNEIVSRHGGTIKVESKEGEGTCFYIFIPRNTTDENSIEGGLSCL
ncbi:integral membrane sensor signal transduction histidine kinase [Thermodesulfatator indicus DSM 15286]|uniref:histidine kinase n=1 Tax=Thermodesulfatator indicus (strain DSM 15286 / JCM 11887 / CIR29812) TaxID=667014 RepID=F8AA71_THEID|nr:HAMP domain-containing sensor histidine kinase [Thermodesulfatator indicus]AEH44207.1 integral membrane sensor signal transduction histidine kinase [Thermodesulfatator indicus DSM 15286]